MKMCGDCIYYPICGQWVEESETFPEIEGGCKVFKSKADFVEVVRCKDCKYYETDIWDGEILCGCGNSSGLNDDKPDGYCCYGERRKENVFCQEKEV